VGLNPRQKQSGTSINGRSALSKTGKSELRKALYMPALVAARHNPVLKKFYQNLVNQGKAKKSAIGAVMRKLLIIAFAVLKSQTAFNATHPKILKRAA
jgi:transposase